MKASDTLGHERNKNGDKADPISCFLFLVPDSRFYFTAVASTFCRQSALEARVQCEVRGYDAATAAAVAAG